MIASQNAIYLTKHFLVKNDMMSIVREEDIARAEEVMLTDSMVRLGSLLTDMDEVDEVNQAH
jgi:hypothetical protein